MNISLLTTTNSHLAGGLYNSVRSLGLAMHAQGVDVNLVSYNDRYSIDDIEAYGELPMYVYHRSNLPILSRLGYSSDLSQLLKEIRPDIIHSQGIWMYNSKAALDYKLHHKKTVSIVAPRGMLDPWAIKQSAWLKSIVGRWFEYSHLESCDCIHALCLSEYESIRKFGLKNPVAIIPNGITMPKATSLNHNHEKNILIFIGRIHPKKGIKELIMGLNIIKEQNPSLLNSWEIQIAGWDQNGHLNELKHLVEINHLTNNVKFVGALLGEAKEKALSQASAFILPSFSEGLPMSVLEAWAYKLPVIMTDYCNLPEGFKSNAAFRISPMPESISQILQDVFSADNTRLKEIGNNGYSLVNRKFTWDRVANQTIELYKYLINGGKKPDFVYD